MARRKKRQRSSDDRAAQLRRRRQVSNEDLGPDDRAARLRAQMGRKQTPSTRDLQEALGPQGPSRTGAQEDRAAQLRGQLSQGNKSAERMAQRALMGEMQNRNQGNMPSRLDREGSVREAALAREAELFGGRNPNRRNPQADVPQQRPPVRGASRRTQGREPSRRHLMQTQGPESLGARGQRDLADHARRALESASAARAGVPQDARRLTNGQRAAPPASDRDQLKAPAPVPARISDRERLRPPSSPRPVQTPPQDEAPSLSFMDRINAAAEKEKPKKVAVQENRLKLETGGCADHDRPKNKIRIKIRRTK